MSDPLVVTLSGDLEMARVPEIRAQLLPLYDADDARIDLTAVRFFDSTFLGELAALEKHRHASGRSTTTLVLNSPLLERVLVTMGLDRIFVIEQRYAPAPSGI